ncbi:MAG: hypothetical protein MGG11_09540 [Trichodesmium sp. MAG_R03]|nr:hypothetical protein [Trichodesmium sp. MAG_R03]
MLKCFLVRQKYISRGWAYRDKKTDIETSSQTTAKVAAACEMSTRRGATAR